jgi:hypothetical protein
MKERCSPGYRRRLLDIDALPAFLDDLGFKAVTFSYPLTNLNSSFLGYRDSGVVDFTQAAHPGAGVQRTSRGRRKHDPPAEPGAGELNGTKHNHNGEAKADRGKSFRDHAETLIRDDCNREDETQSRGENKPAFHAANLSPCRAKLFRVIARVWPDTMRLSP